MTDYSFYMSANLERYLGKWIAIVNKKVIAEGENVKEVYEEARKKYPSKKPLVVCVPKSAAMIF